MKFKNNLLGFINSLYDALFKYMIDEHGDEWVDITIEVKLLDGTTIKRSWSDRNKFLEER